MSSRPRGIRPANLLEESLGSTVSCDKCAVDKYGVSNLISSDRNLQQNGFVVEHFIRPPVDIIFNLPCVSDVSYLKLRLAKGSQKIGRLLVSVKYSRTSDEWSKLFFENDPRHELTIQCGKSLPRHLVLHGIGKLDKSVGSCRSITNIRVTILAMTDCRAVALFGCEAYGLPSNCVDGSHEIWRKLRPHSFPKNEKEGIPLGGDSRSDRRSSVSSHDQGDPFSVANSSKRLKPSERREVPEEFLDALTFTIMTIPVLLPSGNVIDKNSFDRHRSNEIRWGRPFCDPFTGVQMSSSPVVLAELKSRIDHFWYSTSSGSSESTDGVRLLDGRNINRKEVSTLLSNTPDAKHATKIDKPPGALKDAEKISGQSNRSDVLSLEDSLREALVTARKILRLDEKAKIDKNCSNCRNIDVKYKRECAHYLCRECADVHSNNNCPDCGAVSSRSSIVRIHVV